MSPAPYMILDNSQPRLALSVKGELLEWVEVRGSHLPYGAARFNWELLPLQEVPETAMGPLLTRLEGALGLPASTLSADSLPAALAASAAMIRRLAPHLREPVAA